LGYYEGPTISTMRSLQRFSNVYTNETFVHSHMLNVKMVND